MSVVRSAARGASLDDAVTEAAAPSRVVLGALFAAAVDLGRALSHADSNDWGRRSLEGSGGVSVLGVLNDALHESHDQLREVEALLDRAANPQLPPTSRVRTCVATVGGDDEAA
jgi:hypothetical protein